MLHQDVQQTQSQLEAMNLAAANAPAGDINMLCAQANVQANVPGLNVDAGENA